MYMEKKISILGVTGPTASGKTALGIALAEAFSGEIVSCDSMQIYKGLPIGTAQPSAGELQAVPHHLVGFLDPWESFSVSDYERLASGVIREIDSRRKLPVLVGGAGLYIRSLLGGFTFSEHGRSEELRQGLYRRAGEEGSDVLYRELQALDPVGAQGIHPHNVKRIVRALEYCKLTGEPFSAQTERSQSALPPYDALLVCLCFRDRQKLYARINRRVDAMLEAGLLEEAEDFFRKCRERGAPPTAAQAIGYKELFPYFEGAVSLTEAVENVRRESRRYAKRQITWFSREPGALPLYVDDFSGPGELVGEAVRLADAWKRGKEGRNL